MIRKIAALLVLFAALILIAYQKSERHYNSAPQRIEKEGTVQPANQTPHNVKNSNPAPAISKSHEPQESKTLSLNAENFERLFPSCFQGISCEIEEPIKLYLYFKRSQHPSVGDSIIALMRKNLQEPKFKGRYANELLSIINDYYGPKEIQFQQAAYYAYIGNLEKSLALYLDLEKKSQRDSSLRSAPKLNIANVYYDLRRFQEALPYYKSALSEFLTDKDGVKDQDAVIQFIQMRIDEIKRALSQT